MLVEEREVFLPFETFPWFREAPIGQLVNVTLPQPRHLYWPDLDVDLAVESIDHPAKFPLVSNWRPNKGMQTIFPILRNNDARAAMRSLSATFGFVELFSVPESGQIVRHAQLKLGTNIIMLGSARSDEATARP